MTTLLFAALLGLATPGAPTQSTSDLDFMIGTWDLAGTFGPGTPTERHETGSQICAYIMDKAYVRCERRLTGTNGRSREQITFHNFNKLYGRFEHLFISSNWPTKVIGFSGLKVDKQSVTLDPQMSFLLPDGRTEHVRSIDTFSAGRFEHVEQLKVSGDAQGKDGWRANYRLVGSRRAN